ncbi:MAG: hydroxymethylbilane synthase [Bacteroidetes bacterium]|nr:hydroxymethylbilane synthase [Bacteroidota bacterium]
MKVRLGSRTSELALWQTHQVEEKLKGLVESEVVGISTQGDQDRQTPLYQMGGQGVFTKALDTALLENQIDLAIHSLKDYPSSEPEGLKLFAVLERDFNHDVFIPGKRNETNLELTLASGSPRRKAQWWRHYPHHQFINLRGNMRTRLEKMQEVDGGIVSQAGLQRLGILPPNHEVLNWMIPAPAQGVMAIVGRAEDEELYQIVQKINHESTWRCSHIERQFMATLEAGCSAPLGAFASIIKQGINFKGILTNSNGKKAVEIEDEFPSDEWQHAGKRLANDVLQRGGQAIMDELRSEQA